MQQPDPYAIYGLIDPRDHNVFYVGMTDDVYARFLQHLRCDGSNLMKDARIQELRDAGIMVVMSTLQLVRGLEDARKREAYWIRHYHDLGTLLTNQVIPISHEHTIIVRVPITQTLEQKPRLKALMSPEEQEAYVLYLMDTGLSRKSIKAKADGYIHPTFVDTILDACMQRSCVSASVPDAQVSLSPGRQEVDAQTEATPRTLDGPRSTQDECTTDYPLLSDLQIELFTTAYQITGNIDRSLEHASANTRYREHAREIIRERNLKKHEA
jgi:hypothetical protein